MVEIVALMVAVAVLARAVPFARERRRRQRAEEELRDALPDTIDLFQVMLGAGVSVDVGVRWVAEQGPQPVRAAFQAVIERARAGSPLMVAMRSLTVELGPAFQPLVAVLIAAVRDGVPTSTLLLRLGDEARAARRLRAERLARSLPVRMIFPLVCCSLPAVLIGAVVPLILAFLARL